jgi:isoquinoline 1-oxidoreductase alpha subunit
MAAMRERGPLRGGMAAMPNRYSVRRNRAPTIARVAGPCLAAAMQAPRGSATDNTVPARRHNGDTAMPRITVNGNSHDLDVEPEMPLLWVLRDALEMTGTKYGCGIGLCGACTVHIDGVATRACTVAVGDLGTRQVTTIEGLGRSGQHPVQAAWIASQVPQCGYCQCGMVMAVAALLQKHPRPTDAQVDEGVGNLCRCGTYPRVRAAIRRLATAA